MIDPRQLGFDIDGVVANTMQLFIDIAREAYGLNHISYQDITNYHLEECLDMRPETIRAIVARIIEGERHAGNKPEAFNRGLRFIFQDQ